MGKLKEAETQSNTTVQSKEVAQILDRINMERVNERYSLSGLSEAIGKSNSYLGQVMRGDIDMTLDTLIEISKVLTRKEAPDIRNWFAKEVKSSYQITRWYDGKVDKADAPSRILRTAAIENEKHDFYSLFDPRAAKQSFITDFQMLLIKHHENIETKRHYHLGDEFMFSLEGVFECNILKRDTKNRLKKGQKDEDRYESIHFADSDETTDYVWLEAWIPHQIVNVSKEKSAWSLNIYYDPHGEGGVYDFDNGDDDPEQPSGRRKDHQERFVDSRTNYEAVKTGIGIRLEKLRLKAGMSWDSFLKRCKSLDETGTFKMSRLSLQRLEAGQTNPSLEQIILFAKALDVPPTDFIPPVRVVESGKVAELPLHTGPGLVSNGRKRPEARRLISDKVNSSLEVQVLDFAENDVYDLTYNDHDVSFFVERGQLDVTIEVVTEIEDNERLKTVKQITLDKWATIYLRKRTRYTLTARNNTRVLLVHKRFEENEV